MGSARNHNGALSNLGDVFITAASVSLLANINGTLRRARDAVFPTEGVNHLLASCSFPAGQPPYQCVAVHAPMNGLRKCMGSHCDCVGRYDNFPWMARNVERKREGEERGRGRQSESRE